MIKTLVSEFIDNHPYLTYIISMIGYYLIIVAIYNTEIGKQLLDKTFCDVLYIRADFGECND